MTKVLQMPSGGQDMLECVCAGFHTGFCILRGGIPKFGVDVEGCIVITTGGVWGHAPPRIKINK